MSWYCWHVALLVYKPVISIGYIPRVRLLSDLATECRRHEVAKSLGRHEVAKSLGRHEVAKSLGNQARGVQPTCTMTTQNSKIRLIISIALESRLIT